MKISLDLPDTAALARLDQTYFREVLVATLYYIGKLSEKEACLTLGISRRTFERLLPRFGFSILSIPNLDMHPVRSRKHEVEP